MPPDDYSTHRHAMESAYEALLSKPHDRKEITELLGIRDPQVQIVPAPISAATARSGRGWQWWNRPRRLALSDLQGWQPSRLKFQYTWAELECSSGECPDVHFELLYGDLFVRVYEFARRYFGETGNRSSTSVDQDTSFGEQTSFSPWVDGGYASGELVYYATHVARQDGFVGGWDGLHRRSSLRQALVCGIIAKVLEAGVFDKLLFGASTNQEALLDAQDETTLKSDGYERADVRARLIRTGLGYEALTPNFWSTVDKLTTRLLALLLPLYNPVDVGSTYRRSLLRAIHQDLHQIVAEAGYLAIGMRRSRTIFRFVAPLPGDRWDDDYMDAMPEVYEASKAAARRATAGADSRSACHRYPTAKVQIVLWPELQRWSPLGRIGFADEDKDDGRYPTETSDFVGGKTVSTIMKSQVVYYAGNADSEEARPEAISSLRQHARAIKRNRLRRKAVPFLCLFALVIVSVLLLFWRTRVIAWIGKTTEGMSNRMSSIDVEKEKIEPDDPPAFARRAVRRSVDWAYIRESLKRLLMRPFRGGHAWNQ